MAAVFPAPAGPTRTLSIRPDTAIRASASAWSSPSSRPSASARRVIFSTAHFGDYADARAHLDDALGLLANCADIYARCGDTNRRLCNQAFFTKVFIDEDNELRVEHNRPFEMILDPQVNANALTWATDAHKARTSTNISVGKGRALCVRWTSVESLRTPAHT